MKKIFTLSLLRITTLIVALAGAAGSVGLVLYMGRYNKSWLLILLFVGWVLSPYIALLLANLVSKTWPALTRVWLYILMIVLSILSVVIYTGVWSPPGTKTAFVFLVVPFVSWLLMAIFFLIARSWSQRLSGGNTGD